MIVEPNARDPELSGSLDAPPLLYSSFSKTRPGGGRLATAAGRLFVAGKTGVLTAFVLTPH